MADVLRALRDGRRVHGWEVARLCGQSPPTVYRVLQRLCEAGWVDYEWEAHNPEPGKPRRRFYWLTEDGRVGARAVLRARTAAERSAGVVRRGRASLAGGGL